MFTEPFHLDLTQNVILGYENPKSKEAVESIKRGIQAEDEFPPIILYQISEKIFTLTHSHNVKTLDGKLIVDGGHTRALAHLIEKVPILCQIQKQRLMMMPGYPDPNGTIKITDIQIISDPKYFEYKKSIFPNYK